MNLLDRPFNARAISYSRDCGLALNLSQNENLDQELQTIFLDMVKTRLSEKFVSCYPQMARAYQNTSEFFDTSPDAIVLASGADEALRLCYHCLSLQGYKSIGIVSPTYGMNYVYHPLFGLRTEQLQYVRGSSVFEFPAAEVFKFISNASAKHCLILSYPDSPTGFTLPEDLLREILDLSRDKNLPLVIDQTYVPFGGVDLISYIDDYPNLILIRSFSKMAPMAGLRVGCVVSSRDWVRKINLCRGMYELSSIACLGVEICNVLKSEIFQSCEAVSQQRDVFSKKIRSLGYVCPPSGGNFALFDLGGRVPKFSELIRSDFILRYFQGDSLLHGFVRVSIGDAALMKRVEARIIEVLSDV